MSAITCALEGASQLLLECEPMDDDWCWRWRWLSEHGRRICLTGRGWM